MIKQITVFLENTEGRLAALTHTLRRANVNMYALTIAETSDYGLVRIICDDPDAALEALRAEDFRATQTNVSAIEVPNRPGGLAELLDTLASLNMNIEYGYKISGHAHTAEATFKLEEAGFKPLRQEDLA